jgi:hypothetical protein
MRIHLLATATVVWLTPLVLAGEGKGGNPFRDVRVGDIQVRGGPKCCRHGRADVPLRVGVPGGGGRWHRRHLDHPV